MSEQILSPLMISEINALIDERLKEIPREVEVPRFASISTAAEISGYKPQTIRAWLAKRKIKNYGKPRSPRVRMDEILKLD